MGRAVIRFQSLVILTALASVLVAAPAFAHLALIRQGPESNGTLDSGDRTGSALATGDFNGDGFDDLAIGCPNETLSSLVGAGSVVVVYGSPQGLTHVGSDFLSASSSGGTTLADARFGEALASGNFDGDAYDDLAIGAPGEDVGMLDEAGRVYVLHGNLNGIGGVADAILTQATGGEINEAEDNFGASLAAADFSGDGRDDLAAGSPGEDTSAGAVFYFPGGVAGITGAGATYFKQGTLGQLAANDDIFGTALAAGDVYGDSRADLAVGAPWRTAGGEVRAGVVYLIQGGPDGLTTANSAVYTADDSDTPEALAEFGASGSES